MQDTNFRGLFSLVNGTGRCLLYLIFLCGQIPLLGYDAPCLGLRKIREYPIFSKLLQEFRKSSTHSRLKAVDGNNA